ncbi:hypothetical protein WS61_31370 [Burkholderia sp. ABCPW 11]|uniref:hypothetical protein n=1 Tax=Burkholderia sp. ABCPW 11 TaxID=1637859 RepID=UPI00075EC929|nr:hypothetical protein [Burkholderia sp. ABCPW 11]KVD50305.1 hypothetical protein WS61_31370 [Burkholderia sp. ABCPW 11]
MTIDQRLENWANAQRGGPGGNDGLTASIYFKSIPGIAIDSTLDLADANRVEAAMRKIMPLDRQLLQMHYVWRKPPFLICRRLGLKVRPTSIFDLQLVHAKRSLEERLREPKREYVSMSSVIEHLSRRPLAESK